MKIISILIICGLSLHCFGQIKLPSIFSDNMVLQQNSEASVWGWGDPGFEVGVSGSWSKDTVKAMVSNQAIWKAKLKTPGAGGPFTISIKGKEEVVLKNVMIGEVWICSGQSNMELKAYHKFNNAEEEVKNDNYPNIRFFQVKKWAVKLPRIIVLPNGRSVHRNLYIHSVPWYFFGRYLQQNLNVPICLIEATWGGTPAEVWVKADIVESDSLLKAGAAKLKTIKWWPSRPGVVYNAMIAPLVPFRIAGEWKASWIGLDSLTNPGEQLNEVVNTRLSARYLRKEFDLNKEIQSAKLHISGLGMYECYLNGSKVSKDIFAPTATDYDKHVNYNTYDVTSLLKNDKNTIGVVLGNGRFFSLRMTNDKAFGIPVIRHFGFPKLLMQMEIKYKNGNKTTIVSDATWKLSTHGPIIANSEYDGEEYNANLELHGWNKNGYNDATWMQARIVDAPLGKLVAQNNPNIMSMEEVKPVSIKEVNGKYILDMGQNMVGWLAVKLNGTKDKPVKMRFAETTQKDGSLYMANLRGAKVTNIYTPSKDGEFSWCPTFTYQGFRYVEISGISYKPELNDFVGKVNYDEMKTIGSFETSNELINQIYKNACWGIKGNYRSFPTDCPQRDERMGWLGDRATGCLGESFIFDNNLLYAKWVQDIEDTQRGNGSLCDVAPNYWQFYSDNITWPAAYIHAANMVYGQRGDTLPIVLHYASMKKWLDFMKTSFMKDYLMEKDVYGDWCMPPERLDLIHSQDPTRKTDGTLLATSFYYRLLELMAKFARISGHQEDATAFNVLAVNVKKAYNDKFLDKGKGQYGNNTVTANLASLMQGLVPEEYQDKVFKNIVDKTEGEFKSHVGVGLIGIQFLMRGLTAHGRGDLAYKIATNRTYPSWGYMIDNKATTIWELWNGNTADPAMNSGNHVMLLGDLLTWYYENLAGIKTDNKMVGFRKIIMNPIFPDGLNHVKASTQSPYGKISSEWTKNENGLQWNIEIPANTSALVSIPAASSEKISVNDSQLNSIEGLTIVSNKDGVVTLQVESGKYRFKIVK